MLQRLGARAPGARDLARAWWSRACAAAAGGPAGGVDTQYRTPTEAVWPASRRQARLASRVHRALGEALARDADLSARLVGALGFAVKGVRASPDGLKAFVLWDSLAGRPDDAAAELARRAPRLRAAVAAALDARRAPRLEFRRDAPGAADAEVEAALQRLDEERRREAAGGERRRGAAADSGGAQPNSLQGQGRRAT